jgi:uncharacterized protein DUF4357
MEFFLAQVQLVLPVLGFAFTQPRPAGGDGSTSTGTVQESPVFVMSPVGTHARAQQIDDEFVVFKESTARKHGLPSWTSYKQLRDQLVQEGKLIDSPDPDLYLFADDIPFNSPSAAAAVVFGGNQAGPTVWKTKDGQTYREWQEAKLAQAGVKVGKG